MAYKGRHGQSTPQKALSGADVLFDDELKVFFDYLHRRAETEGDRRCFTARRWLLICDILLRTGMRTMELCKLRVQDTPIVLGRNEIYVYRGKNQKDRPIPISQRLADEIARYCKEVRPKTMPRRIRRSDTSRPLFYSVMKKPFSGIGIYSLVRTAGERAGLPKRLHPHMFRHTYATRAADGSKANIKELMRLLGHSHIATTEIYINFVDKHYNELGELLDNGFDFGGESA